MNIQLKAVDYLGLKLFELYKEQYPAINMETEVIEITREQTTIELRIPIIMPSSIFAQGPQKPFEQIVFKPEDFEWWAQDKNGPYFKLVYEPRFDRLYGFKVQK